MQKSNWQTERPVIYVSPLRQSRSASAAPESTAASHSAAGAALPVAAEGAAPRSNSTVALLLFVAGSPSAMRAVKRTDSPFQPLPRIAHSRVRRPVDRSHARTTGDGYALLGVGLGVCRLGVVDASQRGKITCTPRRYTAQAHRRAGIACSREGGNASQVRSRRQRRHAPVVQSEELAAGHSHGGNSHARPPAAAIGENWRLCRGGRAEAGAENRSRVKPGRLGRSG